MYHSLSVSFSVILLALGLFTTNHLSLSCSCKKSESENESLKKTNKDLVTEIEDLKKTIDKLREIQSHNNRTILEENQRLKDLLKKTNNELLTENENLKKTTKVQAVDAGLLIQNRSWPLSGTAPNRNWVEYKNGFSAPGFFWLGLERIHQLTKTGVWSLRIEVTHREDWSQHFLVYPKFRIDSEFNGYRLQVDEKAQGNMGDPLRCNRKVTGHHNGRPFSTQDRDHDQKDGENCAIQTGGGWWFDHCQNINMNGKSGFFAYRMNCADNWRLISRSRMLIKQVSG